jgi:hypothetical protein
VTAVRELYDEGGRYLGKERLPETGDRVEHEQEADFEAFWSSYAPTLEEDKPETVTIFGVDVEIPHDLPLKVTVQVERFQDSADIDTIRHLVGLIFDADVLGEWIERDITEEQFAVLLVWGMANGKGQKTTFAEAAALVKAREADKGKAPAPVTPMNRADRRATAKRGYRSGAAGA